MNKAVTLTEILIVIVIIGILAAIGIPIYDNIKEKAALSEAYGQLMSIKMAYQRLKLDHPEIMISGTWGPNISADSNSSWRDMKMENPNSNPGNYFSYDVWNGCTEAAPCSYSFDFEVKKDIVLAIRKTDKTAYSYNTDNSKYIYMYVDNMVVVKSNYYK